MERTEKGEGRGERKRRGDGEREKVGEKRDKEREGKKEG